MSCRQWLISPRHMETRDFSGLVYTVSFRLKLKKVGKTTRPFRYDPNQIPYDYTVEVTDSRD